MTGIWKYTILLSFLGLLFSCTDTPEASTVTPAFYHWKSHYAPTDSELDYLRELQSQKLYVRFFDVVQEAGEPVPVASLENDYSVNRNLEIIQVVYITNAAIKAVNEQDIPILAARIFKKIKTIHPRLSNSALKEIQIDCDWTNSSRQKYFQLLRNLRALLDQQKQRLSVTLRLHQYKNTESTGIPPADRVMLMFYNMGEVNEYEEVNSILNLGVAADYLHAPKPYPLPMDIALPLFQWGCVFRDQKLVELSNNLSLEDLNDKLRFAQISDNRFRVIKSTYLKGYFLYEGDEIRHESVSYDRLLSAGEMLASVKNADAFTAAFYHLDSLSLSRFTPGELNTVLRAVGKGE